MPAVCPLPKITARSSLRADRQSARGAIFALRVNSRSAGIPLSFTRHKAIRKELSTSSTPAHFVCGQKENIHAITYPAGRSKHSHHPVTVSRNIPTYFRKVLYAIHTGSRILGCRTSLALSPSFSQERSCRRPHDRLACRVRIQKFLCSSRRMEKSLTAISG